MALPFIRIGWNKYEAALLVNAYEKVSAGELSRKEASKMLSERLRYRMLLNNIEVSDQYRNENGIYMQMSAIEYCMTRGEKGLENPSKLFVDIATMALDDRESFNILLKEALDLYPEPVSTVQYEQTQEPSFNFVRDVDMNERYSTLGPIKEILSQRFPKGFRLNSTIELIRFQRFYTDFTGREYSGSDTDLTNDIKECGITADNKLFIPGRILSAETKSQIASYIENTFQAGRQYVFYEALFSLFKNELLESIIVDAKMLRSYLHYYYGQKWFFQKHFLSNCRNVKIDIDSVVIDYVKELGRIVNEEDVVSALNYLPADDVVHSFNFNPSILVSCGRGQRFHIDLFVVTRQELDSICEIIDKAIEQYEFVGADELLSDIKKNVPSILSNNSTLSEYGIRKALASKLENRYSFNNAIISTKGHNIAAKDAILSYAKTHDEFTLNEIDALADSLGTVLNYYLESIANYCIRLDQNYFVSRERIQFDIDSIDNAIAIICNDKSPFVPLRSFTNFSAFPDAQFPWTQRLLESYLLTTSRKFSLLHGDYLNKNSVCGVVVKRDYKGHVDELSTMNPFDNILSLVLVHKHVNLKKETALDYLASEGFIVKRRYAQIDQVLAKAKSIIENNDQKE